MRSFNNMALSYRLVNDSQGFERVSDLEMLVWGLDARDTITPHIQRVIVHTGGVVIGAYDGDTLAGFVLGLATRQPGWMWSHIAAVHPEYQRQGIGYALKQQQRDWALAQGYRRMSWTMDPLMCENAHFNFHLLGAQTNTYHVNFYGIADDAINAGQPTDRVQVMWYLDQAPRPHLAAADAPFLLKMEDNWDAISTDESALQSDTCRLEIPYHFRRMKVDEPEKALRLREIVRHRLSQAFETGYTVTDFYRRDERCWYILPKTRPKPLDLSVGM